MDVPADNWNPASFASSTLQCGKPGTAGARRDVHRHRDSFTTACMRLVSAETINWEKDILNLIWRWPGDMAVERLHPLPPLAACQIVHRSLPITFLRCEGDDRQRRRPWRHPLSLLAYISSREREYCNEESKRPDVHVLGRHGPSVKDTRSDTPCACIHGTVSLL